MYVLCLTLKDLLPARLPARRLEHISVLETQAVLLCVKVGQALRQPRHGISAHTSTCICNDCNVGTDNRLKVQDSELRIVRQRTLPVLPS